MIKSMERRPDQTGTAYVTEL